MSKFVGNMVKVLDRCFLKRASHKITIVPVRHSQYNKHYLEPTVNPVELQKPLEADDPRRFKAIKAATLNQTTASHYDPLVEKFISTMMRKGKRELATDIVNRMFEHIKYLQLEKLNKASSVSEKESLDLNPVSVFHKAIDNCKPVLILRKVERRGIEYRVPVPVRPQYQLFQAMKWIIESAKDMDPELRMYKRLAYEVTDAHNNEGKSVRKKQETYRICEKNKAYSHFRR